MLEKGMKVRLVRPMGMFDNVGEICEIINIYDDIIFFNFGENKIHLGGVSRDDFENYFEVYKEPKKEYVKAPTVTQKQIDEIMDDADITVNTTYDKCTVVSVKLPNGFVITESSACVSPENYDKDMGVDICMNKIINKVWELEGYRLQCELYEANEAKCEVECECEECSCCDDCEEVHEKTFSILF